MRDPPAKGGSTHILFIDMMWGEIPGNTCEEIDIAFAYSLGKFYCLADTYVKFGYRWFLRKVRHDFEFFWNFRPGCYSDN